MKLKFQPYFEADKGASGNAETQPGNAASAGTEEAKTYTQAELDKLFADRAKQASSSEQKRILTELGAKDLEEAKALLKKQKEAEEAQLSEMDKLKAKVTEQDTYRAQLEKTQREINTQYEIKLQALTLGISDPEDAYKLLDLSKLEFDEKTGKPTNVEAVLRELVGSKPYLLGKSGGSSSTNPAGGRTSKLTMDDIKKMSPEEVNSRWEEVSVVMAQK
jgi:hypothetical protein